MAISGGLLIAAAILSLILGNWDVLIGMTLALAMIAAGECASEWSYRYSEETEKHREKLIGKSTIQTTYYYDDDDEEPPSNPEGGKDSPL
ncbi:hypothetical protein [uncultured Arthrobacter sp.]|uniref:hypothetical protein n=1 Tax=uncultured Arthrobacter sp. TaxID=114050 RepID=UPI0025FF1D12|nr:hypothetical protein [uncultured Arthrobacter sp.]